jgi:hypothetical protein
LRNYFSAAPSPRKERPKPQRESSRNLPEKPKYAELSDEDAYEDEDDYVTETKPKTTPSPKKATPKRKATPPPEEHDLR